MVRHIVAWNFKEGFTPEQNRQNALEVKSRIEGLSNLLDGIIELKVNIDLLPTGNRDVFLTSLFLSEDVLAAYQVHPDHKRVGEFVGSVLQDRTCVDYVE